MPGALGEQKGSCLYIYLVHNFYSMNSCIIYTHLYAIIASTIHRNSGASCPNRRGVEKQLRVRKGGRKKSRAPTLVLPQLKWNIGAKANVLYL